MEFKIFHSFNYLYLHFHNMTSLCCKDTKNIRLNKRYWLASGTFYSPIRSMDKFLIFFNKWQKMANNPYLSFFSCLSNF